MALHHSCLSLRQPALDHGWFTFVVGDITFPCHHCHFQMVEHSTGHKPVTSPFLTGHKPNCPDITEILLSGC